MHRSQVRLPVGMNGLLKMERISDYKHATNMTQPDNSTYISLYKLNSYIKKNIASNPHDSLSGDAIRYSIKCTLLCEWVDMQIICFTNYS